MSKLPDVFEHLLYDPAFMDPHESRGLWFCDCAESVYAIKINAVCLAAGGSFEALSSCANFVDKFPYLVVVCPDEHRREVMVSELRPRVTIPILVAETEAFRGCKTVRELGEKHGTKALDRIIMETTELPDYGLLNLADVKQPDVAALPKTSSGIAELDRTIGGFYMGELSVWTGKRGQGKSTLLDQLLIEAIDQGHRVCAYSGELSAWRFKHWALLQAAGPEHIVIQADKETGRRMATVPPNIAKRIDEWWNKRFLLYDLQIGAAHDEDSILRIFEYAHRIYGADVFLVDNIMTARFKTGRDADFYRAQSNFVGRLVSFAKKFNVHVHLVAHPRKTGSGAGKKPEADDVGGAGDITNRADNVFALGRKMVKDGDGLEPTPVLAVLKNRAYGETRELLLAFDKGSKRFYSPMSGKADKRFGWDLTGRQMEILPDSTPVPFERSECHDGRQADAADPGGGTPTPGPGPGGCSAPA